MRPSVELPSHVYARLAAEHARIRAAIVELEQLCVELDAERAVELATRLSRFAVLIASHNANEEAALRALLSTVDAFGPERVERMIGDHAAEHTAMRQMLVPLGKLDPVPLAAGTRHLIDVVRRHLEEEERSFLNPRVLRDDVVAIDGDDRF